MRSRLFLGLVIVFHLDSWLCAQDAHPVGVILDSTGERTAWKKLLNDETRVTARAGMALWPGEVLETAPNGTIRFIFCPSKTEQTLAPGSSLTITALRLPGQLDLLTDVKPLHQKCQMPFVEQVKPEDRPAQQHSGDCATALATSLFHAMDLESTGDDDAYQEYQKVGAACDAAEWTERIKFAPPHEPPTAPPAHGKTFALLIGIAAYGDGTDLQFAANDAEAFKSFLESPRGGAVPKDQIILLRNNEATRDRIHASVKALETAAKGDQNTLILLLAGHGSIGDDVPYFRAYDSKQDDLKSTGYPMDRISQMIREEANQFARVIAFIDICHAEYSGDQLSGRAVRDELLRRQHRVGILMASDSEQFAYEDARLANHGVFTYFVLEGLNGGITDPITPPVITFNELSGHVSKQVAKFTGSKQTPVGKGFPPTMPVLDDSTQAAWGHEIPVANPASLRPLSEKEIAGMRRRGSVPQIGAYTPPFRPTDPFAELAGRDPLAAVPVYERAAADSDTPPDTKGKMAETLRVSLAEHGQEILGQYIEGEQLGLTQADFFQGKEYFEHAVRLPRASAFDESRLFFFRGREMIFERKYEDAIRSLEHSILLDPNRAYSYNALGLAYLEEKNFARAIAAFNDALQFAPHWSYPRHNLALAYSQQGNFAAAQQQYMRAMLNAPHYSYLPYNLGLINQRMNRLDEAKRLYLQAAKNAEDNRKSGLVPLIYPWTERADILNALGTVEAARNKYGKAEEYYRNALREAPALAAAKYNLAVILSRKVKTQREAIDLWRENAGAVDSAIALASRLALGDYFAHHDGGRNQAIAEYVEAVNLDEANLSARRALARLYKEAEQWADAYEQWKALRKDSPKSPEVTEQFARAAAKAGRLEEAADAYHEASKLFRKDGDRKRVERELESLQSMRRR